MHVLGASAVGSPSGLKPPPPMGCYGLHIEEGDETLNDFIDEAVPATSILPVCDTSYN
jgi:hypothetical protein